jgi:hypothetical protein
MDLFLAYAYQDEPYAGGLADILVGRGPEVGEPLPLWQGLYGLWVLWTGT